MIFATTSITVDPAWPWSLPALGISAFGGVAILLTALTAWTYLGVRGASWQRVGLVLALRLMALLVAFVVVLRPALAFEDVQDEVPSRLFFLLDYSESMKITDDFNGLSRWANASRILATPVVKSALASLTDARVELGFYQGAEDLRKYDPGSQPLGLATDMGSWLHEIRQRHGREKNLRGLVLFSDGADNGTKFPTLEEAAQMRGTCPIFTFGLGRPTTTSKQNDIELTDIRVEPEPIPVKGKMTVKGYANAPGFENSIVNASVWIQELGAKEPRLAGAVRQVLSKTQRNEVAVTCDAPDAAGEIKVTLKIQPLAGEVNAQNNEISTYATVTKEGVSILWVEGRRPRYESVFANRHALANDRRFRVNFTERLTEEKPSSDSDGFEFDKRHYDVIVIGDISAKRLAGGDQDFFKKVSSLVIDKGTGLLMMGGYETPWAQGNDWGQPAAQPLTDLLPVDLGPRSQIDHKVQVEPTADGKKYLLRLEESSEKNERLWTKTLDPLDGLTDLGSPKANSTVLARGAVDKEPILVETTRGNGRVLVFAGDTTWKVWRRTESALPAYARFWKQLMLYLARQENLDSNVQIILDKRRVAADSNQRLAFTLKARGKNGLDVKNPQFTVKVTAPNNEETEVPVALDGGEYRGYFLKTNVAGDYRLEAAVKGKDTDGNELAAKPSVAHFLGFAQDREMLRPAADHEFLAKIAGASGGQFALADEHKVASLLRELLNQRDQQPRGKVDLWPDWRRQPASDSLVGDQIATLWHSTALPCFLAFVSLLCTEWYLRRRWGLV